VSVPRAPHPLRRRLLWLQTFGGLAVLGSYAHGLATHPTLRGAVWGGVPDELRPFYTFSMLAAAAGWFAFTFYVGLRVDPDRARIAGRFGYATFVWLYALILVPSALWMPLTFEMLVAPSAALWWAIRAVLATVGSASFALVLAIATVQPRGGTAARRVALVGALAFTFQTAVLDALAWPAWFPT
jgi:hypothetical protein